MRNWTQDLRFGLRILTRRPGFAISAAATLALGICAATAVFSVMAAVVLQPLPYADGDELVMVRNQERATGTIHGAAWPEYLEWQQAASALVPDMAVYIDRPFNVTGSSEPVQVWGSQVSKEFFSTLRAPAARGRTFAGAEQVEGGRRAVVLSHQFWQRWMGGDEDTVGRVLNLDEEPFEIVGVMPKDFRSPSEPVELWVSLEPMRENLPQDFGLKFFNVVGRLAEETSRQAAEERLAVVGDRLEAEYPQANTGLAPHLVPMREQLAGSAGPALLVLFGAGALVLLIACVNVANLLLARASARRRELAIRRAVGVTQSRLFRQLFSESLVLTIIGGTVGVALSVAVIALLGDLLPPNLLPPGSELAVDGRSLAFSVAVVVLVAVLISLAPLVRWHRARGARELTSGRSAAAQGAGPARLRSALVVGEVALALVLLMGASLLMRSFLELRAVDPGFRSEGVLSLYLLVPESRYPDEASRQVFLNQVEEELGRLPGVTAVGTVSHLPMANNDVVEEFSVVGRAPIPGEVRQAGYRGVAGDYFSAMGIPLVSGRTFTQVDQAEGRRVVVINQALAERYFQDQDPLGRRLRLQGMMPETEEFGQTSEHRIVGVVGDVRHLSLSTAPRAEVYLPYLRMPWSVFYVVVRASGDPIALADEVRSGIWSVDPDLPIADLQTMQQRLHGSVAQPRFNALLLGAFSLVAFLLAAVGIYAVSSYMVSERVQEFGVRLTLGATRGDIRRLVLRRGLRLAALGIAGGLVVSLLLARLLESMTHQAEGFSIALFALVGTALLGVALVACWMPARRATKVDLAHSLRSE